MTIHSKKLPCGLTLYWEEDETGGIRYSSDEVGCVSTIWLTSLVSIDVLEEAIKIEKERRLKR